MKRGGGENRKQSAGTLLYRLTETGWEALIVRPSGPSARYGWSIPKGIPNRGEELEAAARRETWEETGVSVAGPLTDLGFIDYRKSRKRVHCFGGPAPDDADPAARSWEVDQARFVPLAEARDLLHPDQAAFIDSLEAHIQEGS
jgi:predicted NUDIX family NTP pyrophosphohydrolase